jgi:hypothetical protein
MKAKEDKKEGQATFSDVGARLCHREKIGSYILPSSIP